MLTNTVTRAVGTQGNSPEIRAPTDVTLAIKDTKLYVPVVTLSTPDDNKLLQEL